MSDSKIENPAITLTPPSGLNFVKVREMVKRLTGAMDSKQEYYFEPGEETYINLSNVVRIRKEFGYDNITGVVFSCNSYMAIEGSLEETKKKFGIFE